MSWCSISSAVLEDLVIRENKQILFLLYSEMEGMREAFSQNDPQFIRPLGQILASRIFEPKRTSGII